MARDLVRMWWVLWSVKSCDGVGGSEGCEANLGGDAGWLGCDMLVTRDCGARDCEVGPNRFVILSPQGEGSQGPAGIRGRCRRCFVQRVLRDAGRAWTEVWDVAPLRVVVIPGRVRPLA